MRQPNRLQIVLMTIGLAGIATPICLMIHRSALEQSQHGAGVSLRIVLIAIWCLGVLGPAAYSGIPYCYATIQADGDVEISPFTVASEQP